MKNEKVIDILVGIIVIAAVVLVGCIGKITNADWMDEYTLLVMLWSIAGLTIGASVMDGTDLGEEDYEEDY